MLLLSTTQNKHPWPALCHFWPVLWCLWPALCAKKGCLITANYGKYNNGSDHIFAYVCKTDDHEEDDYGQIFFKKFGKYQFIEVIGIDRCVGFFRIENLFYILDRERI